jgi:hypothetical protein
MHTIDLPKQEREASDPDVSSLHHRDEPLFACKITEAHTFPQTDSVEAKEGVRNLSGVRFDTGHLNGVCKESLLNLGKPIMPCGYVEGEIPRWPNEPMKSLFQKMQNMGAYTPYKTTRFHRPQGQ